jgi:endonuclease YncB( thermonuclease family)
LADFTGKVVGVLTEQHYGTAKSRASNGAFGGHRRRKTRAFGQIQTGLEVLVKGREVLVVERGQDRYHRTLGRIYRGDLDVNAEQVRQGMAWVYRKYVKDATLYPIEAEAREQRRGLWRDPEPVPPWEWRKTKGH